MEEKEVELIDYLNVIWKRKVLILGGTLLAAVTALGVSLLMPKTYEVSRTLKIGQVQGVNIENREAVMDRLRDHRVLADAIKQLQLGTTPREMAGLVSIDAKTNPHIRYKVQGPDPELVARIADWLGEYVIEVHRRIFDKGMQIAKGYEAELGTKIHRLSVEIAAMRRTLELIVKSPGVDPPGVILLQANIEERERTLTGLDRELKEARISTILTSENTKVISADAVPELPVKPRVKLNVALAGTVGLLMFTFLAFLLEYIEKARRRGG